ncbi:MAG TPA: hypothetical protein ENI82_05865 [Bacteroidetes bacterium]|nr:hypothetical protein [Bacteroidota bacterium]
MKYLIPAVISTILFSSCFLFYTFKDISIEPDVKTFYVEEFDNTAFNSPPTINQDFAEALRKKIVNETSLTYDDRNPDIIFSGDIKSYNVTPQAPTQEGASLNRLDIKIKVKFENSLHENENWENTFGYYADFSAEQSLFNVQDELIKEIFDQILEDVINKAFNNW